MGVNLVEAESGPKVIKVWDERLDEDTFIESGVDDEVSCAGSNASDFHS